MTGGNVGSGLVGRSDDINHQELKHYYPLPGVQTLIQQLLSRPGYQLVESEKGTGKTLLYYYLKHAHQTPSRIIIGYSFNRAEDEPSISRAIEALAEDLQELVRQEGIQLRRDVTPARLRTLIEEIDQQTHKQIVVLIDGLQGLAHADVAKLHLLLPIFYRDLKQTTIVVFVRPLVKSKSDVSTLPVEYRHPLITNPGTVFSLPYFSEHDVLQLLLTHPPPQLTEADLAQVAQHMFRLSSQAAQPGYPPAQPGYPLYVRETFDYIYHNKEAAHVLLKALCEMEDLPNHTEIWQQELRYLQGSFQSDPRHQRLQMDLLALLAIAPAPLSKIELFAILSEVDPASLELVLSQLKGSVVEHKQTLRLAWDDFCRFLLKFDSCQASIKKMELRCEQWFDTFWEASRQASFPSQAIPPYVLKHGAEVWARTKPDGFPQFLAQRQWFEKLDRDVEPFAADDALERAWDVLLAHQGQSWTSLISQQRLITMVCCALTRLSLRRQLPQHQVLPPEFVLALYDLKLWSKQDVLHYAERYPRELRQDAKTILNEIKTKMRSLKPAAKDNMALQQLNDIALLEDKERQAEQVRRWIEDIGAKGLDDQGGIGDDARQEYAALEVALLKSQDLPAPASPLRPTPQMLERLLEPLITWAQVKARHPLPNEFTLFDLAFVLEPLTDALVRLSTEEAQLYILNQVLPIIAPISRIDLLRGLQELAPALRKHFNSSKTLETLSNHISRILNVYP